MAGKRAEPRADEHLQTGVSEQRGEHGGQAERAGPLLLERLRKADGRALILYSVPQERG
jgi:hypothetical protein